MSLWEDIRKEPFGTTADGRPVSRFTLTNRFGMTVRVLDYGCIIQSVIVPDRSGIPRDVVLGYDTLAGYEQGKSWYGAVVGRYANRIRGAAFFLNGRTFRLEENDGGNHLHGVFERRVFEASAGDGRLTLRYRSPDGEEGYPGALDLSVSYALADDGGLEIAYEAFTDADTVINLTNHSYFNLAGQTGSDILSHRLRLASSRFSESDGQTLPTGRLLPAEHTAFDFRKEKAIGRDIGADDPQLRICGGYDHNMVLDKAPGVFGPAGSLLCPDTGIEMELWTTQPAVQLYTGNYLGAHDDPPGKGGLRYPLRGGVCLETQHYPDSPNNPGFPSVLLRPGERFRERTVYRFRTRGGPDDAKSSTAPR